MQSGPCKKSVWKFCCVKIKWVENICGYLRGQYLRFLRGLNWEYLKNNWNKDSTCCKRLGRKFCLVKRWVKSTLVRIKVRNSFEATKVQAESRFVWQNQDTVLYILDSIYQIRTKNVVIAFFVHRKKVHDIFTLKLSSGFTKGIQFWALEPT